MEPLVSILVPAYNSERWIADSLRSALAQKWSRKEIIVVDDGSSDGTLAVARQFASSELLIVRQDNQGPSAARNKALELSQGDYIQYLDADDLLASDKIQKQMAVAEQCDKRTLLSGPFGFFMYRPSHARFCPTALWTDLSPVDWLLLKLEHNLYMQTSVWLVSRELTQAAGPWDTRLARDNDGEYFCRVILASNGIRFVRDAKVFYRTTDSTRVSYVGRSKRKMEALFLSMQLHVEYLRSLEESDRVRKACLQYLQTWLPSFYPESPDLVARAEHLAFSLGGHLRVPELRWKYAWIERLFGYAAAKRTQVFLPQLRLSLKRLWKSTLFRFDGHLLSRGRGRPALDSDSF